MVFLTNNFDWSATTIAELYKARWEVELLGGNAGESHDNMPYLRGFEKYFAEAVG